HQFGQWEVTVTKTDKKSPIKNHFSDAWKGEISTLLPDANYILAPAQANMRRIFADGRTKEYARFLNEKKIPHFLASKVPVIMRDGFVTEDFLTNSPQLDKTCNFHVLLKRGVGSNRKKEE